MTRSTIWRHMAYVTRHPLLNLGMGTMPTLSSRAGDRARWAWCRSPTTSGPNGLIPTSNRRARKPRHNRSCRAPRWRRCGAGLRTDGLIHRSPLSPNAHAFVKYKSLAKCMLIIDMQTFNHAWSFKARPFRPPSLEGLAGLLHSVRGGGGG